MGRNKGYVYGGGILPTFPTLMIRLRPHMAAEEEKTNFSGENFSLPIFYHPQIDPVDGKNLWRERG